MLIASLLLAILTSGWPNMIVSGEAQRNVSDAVEIALDDEAPYQDRLTAIQDAYWGVAQEIRVAGFNGSEDARILRLAPLAEHRDPLLRQYALTALAASGHMEFIRAHAEACPGAEYFDNWQFHDLCVTPVRAAYFQGHITFEVYASFFERLSFDQRVRALEALPQAPEGYEALILTNLSEELWTLDWRLAYRAAVLATQTDIHKPAPIIGALQQVRERHWFPAVMEQAAFSIHVLTTGSVENSGFDWVDEQLQVAQEQLVSDFYIPERLSYGLNVTHTIPQSAWCRDGDWDYGGVTFPASPTFSPGETRSHQVLHDEHATFIGSNHGEWGGSLIAERLSTPPEVIFEGNVVDLLHFQDQNYLVTGLAHLSGDDGTMERIDWDEDASAYSVTRILRLPAAPSFIHALEDNRVGIGAFDWAIVYNVTDNQIEGFAECAHTDKTR